MFIEDYGNEILQIRDDDNHIIESEVNNIPLRTNYDYKTTHKKQPKTYVYTKEQFDEVVAENSKELVFETLKTIEAAELGLRMCGISKDDNMWYVFDKYLSTFEKADFKILVEEKENEIKASKKFKKQMRESRRRNNLSTKQAYDKKMNDKPSFAQWCSQKAMPDTDPYGMHRHVGQDIWNQYIDEVDPRGYKEPIQRGVNFFPY